MAGPEFIMIVTDPLPFEPDIMGKPQIDAGLFIHIDVEPHTQSSGQIGVYLKRSVIQQSKRWFIGFASVRRGLIKSFRTIIREWNKPTRYSPTEIHPEGRQIDHVVTQFNGKGNHRQL